LALFLAYLALYQAAIFLPVQFGADSMLIDMTC
jgi:hypothetical protein